MGAIKAGRPRLMNAVRDGIIMGVIDNVRHPCGVCGHTTRCIIVTSVTMPNGIEADWTILATRDTQGNPTGIIQYIGIGCGDYAKFHRQVAHISDGRKGGVTV